MGCDIHGWVEVKVGDKYIAVKELKSRERNYERFAKLAGVRDYAETSDGTPNGIPNDVSDTAGYDISEWGIDGHSHSYLPLEEAARIFLDTTDKPDEYITKYPAIAFFDYEDEDLSNARLVFWFDN